MKTICTFLFCLFLFPNLVAQTSTDSLTQALQELYDQSTFPGFAVAIANSDGILYEQGFGYADLAAKRSFTEHTTLNIGSVSKTFIGLAIVQLIEKGELEFDTKINDVLPFKIIHPHFPNTAITVEHLVTHTSGIKDTPKYNSECYVLQEDLSQFKNIKPRSTYKYFAKLKGNKEMPLGEFFKSYLVPAGRLYKKKNFTKHPIGTQYEYSNIASALAAYVVEVISGQPFYQYVEDHILEPLNMEVSTWRLEDVDLNQHAKTYSLENDVLPRYSLITYPDGGLMTSANNLGIYLSEIMRMQEGKSELLKQESYQEMAKIRIEHGGKTGVFWEVDERGRLEHGGGDPGIFTYVQVRTEQKIAIAFITNTLAWENKEMLATFSQMWREMVEYGRKQ